MIVSILQIVPSGGKAWANREADLHRGFLRYAIRRFTRNPDVERTIINNDGGETELNLSRYICIYIYS